MVTLAWTNNLRVFASVSAATNCRYFFISVVWSTTVGLGAGTKAMAAAGPGAALNRKRGRRESAALISVWPHAPRWECIWKKILFYFEHLFNWCYFDVLTANTNMPHYGRTVMTSFKDAGDNFFLKSCRLGDWKWTYRENSNFIKTPWAFISDTDSSKIKSMHMRGIFIWRNSKYGWWATVPFQKKELKHLPVFTGV